MSRLRIGEALLSKGLVTPEQLQQALRDQEILGGHLGTCLIELGFIGEDGLGETLGELLNMRYASWSALSGAPDDAIKTLSVELVERYSVVPLQLEDRTLHVATVAPRTLSALSRATGKRIVPWIAPEIRILQAMELHYGIPLQPRYIKIREQLDSAAISIAESSEPETESAEADPVDPESEWISAPNEDDPDAEAGFGYGRSWREIAEQQFDTEPETKPAVEVAPEPSPTPSGFATSSSAGIRRETMRHATGLLRIRMTVDAELAELGFPIDDHATEDALAQWVAKSALDLTLDPQAPNEGRDASGYTYRVVRTTHCPDEGCVLDIPFADRVDFFVAVRLDGQFWVQTVLRASFDAVAAAGTPRKGAIRVLWDTIATQGTGVESLYQSSTATTADSSERLVTTSQD